MNKKTLIILSLVVSMNAKEVSMFGAGDINAKEPYGLSNAEKASYNNKKKLEKLTKKFNYLSTSYSELDQKVQGVISVYEVDSEKLNKNKQEMSNLSNGFESYNLTLERIKQLSVSNSDSLITLEKRIDDFIIQEQKNNSKIQASLKTISSLVNKINNDYTSKAEFNELVDFINGKKSSKIKKTKSKIKKKSNLVTMTKKEKFAKAKAMVAKRYLTKSIPLWDDLIEANYMPAGSNYYLGEVRFGKKEYKKAIHHYKTSMMLYDEAEYIPNLLLHSAISFEKINDKENALNFYNTLIEVYSTSSEANEAKQLIKKLK